MTNTVQCPKCEAAEMLSRTINTSLEIDGEEYPVRGIEFSACPACGYELVFAEQARRNDAKYADARRKAKNLLTSQDIDGVLEKHGLNQSLASKLLGGGANSIYKYRSGEVIQSEPMDLLLRVVRDVPGVLEYVAKHKNIEGITENHASVPAYDKAAMYVITAMTSDEQYIRPQRASYGVPIPATYSIDSDDDESGRLPC